jgi:hypothetical protein
LYLCPAYINKVMQQDIADIKAEEVGGVDLDENDGTEGLFMIKNATVLIFRLSLDAEEEDRGVSAALATVTDLNERIRLLTIHGMLHLLWYVCTDHGLLLCHQLLNILVVLYHSYDHESDADWEQMTKKEEDIIGWLYPKQ